MREIYRSKIENVPRVEMNDLCVCWLVVLRIYFALAIFQPYRDFEAGDNL